MTCGGCAYRATQISAAARAATRLDAQGVAAAGINIALSVRVDASALAARVAARAQALAGKRAGR